MMDYILIFGGAALLILICFVLLYNRLVRSRNEVQNGWAQIDVQLKRRHDLVPNLVTAVKGYASHETQLFANLAEARAGALKATAGSNSTLAVLPEIAIAQAESALSKALGNVIGYAEAYPDLKASDNFLALQEELASTENRIGFARQAFNDAVSLYNTRRETFPANLIAGGFVRREFFRIDDSSQRQVPVIS